MMELHTVVLLCLVLVLSFASGHARQCSRPPAEPQDRRLHADHVTIAHFNVEWLMDGKGDPRSPRNSPAEASAHVARIAKVIKELDADIISLAEVENCAILHELVQSLPGMRYRYYLKGGSDSATGQNMGLLTRVDPYEPLSRSDARASYPVEGSRCGAHKPGSTGVSKHYLARFEFSDRYYLDLYGAHLKAIPNRPSACAKREGQAKVLSQFMRETVGATHMVVLMGDLNDFDPHLVVPQREAPKSDVLNILRSTFDHPDFHHIAVNEEDLEDGHHVPHGIMTNLADQVPYDERYSNWFDRNKNGEVDGSHEHSLIDHVLIDEIGAHYLESVKIVHDHDPTKVSDHWPVVFRLSFPDLAHPDRMTRAEARGKGDPWRDDL